MAMAGVILLPGDTLSPSQVFSSQKRRLGPGLVQATSSEQLTSTLAGRLQLNPKKRTAQISAPDARYIPQPGDLVIGQIHHTSLDFFNLHLSPHTPQAILPQLAFEGATKKTRPQLKPNDLVYAKITFAAKNMEVEVTCVDPSTGKSEPDGLGPLNGGMLFDISTGLAERILKRDGFLVLEELGEKLQGGFEVAVGRNGRVWVDCPEAGVRGICAVGRCLKECDGGRLTEKEQRRLVGRVVSEMGLG